MKPRLAEQTVHRLLELLASGDAPAGGGSAAALTGALAAALGELACALTLGRPRFAAVESQVRDLGQRLHRARTLLEGLMDEDAAALADLMAVWKLDASNPDRAWRLAQAAEMAATVPLETAALCRQVLHDLGELGPLANPVLASDVTCGVHLARAGLWAAAENVRVNLPHVRPPTRERLTRELERLRTAAPDE